MRIIERTGFYLDFKDISIFKTYFPCKIRFYCQNANKSFLNRILHDKNFTFSITRTFSIISTISLNGKLGEVFYCSDP